MTQAQFSLSWGSHTKNISDGLSIFQQNGDFVDMTLAADGHHVKVHQVLMALASPYIKEILSSTPCPHPVLFLNNISYTTLCAILEYIYTGEIYVSVENLVEIKKAAKDLHIKGLENMIIPQQISSDINIPVSQDCEDTEAGNGANGSDLENTVFYVMDDDVTDETPVLPEKNLPDIEEDESKTDDINQEEESDYDHSMDQDTTPVKTRITTNKLPKISSSKANSAAKSTLMQYTVSNQGSLQMILNRYIYYLKHSNRNNTQQWRCVDYLTSIKCPAHIITNNGVVQLRVAVHTHPFHDKKILKKIRAGVVYSAITEAQEQGISIKNRNAEINHESSE